jgi:hypothetical protein
MLTAILVVLILQLGVDVWALGHHRAPKPPQGRVK